LTALRGAPSLHAIARASRVGPPVAEGGARGRGRGPVGRPAGKLGGALRLAARRSAGGAGERHSGGWCLVFKGSTTRRERARLGAAVRELAGGIPCLGQRMRQARPGTGRRWSPSPTG